RLVLLEDDDLGVLATELAYAAHVGVQLLDGERDRVDLLHELRAEVRTQRRAARAGDEGADRGARDVREIRLDALQELEHLLGLFGLVALVVAPEHFLAHGIDNARLDGRRTDVDADTDGLGPAARELRHP